jgi:hypothetical protein
MDGPGPGATTLPPSGISYIARVLKFKTFGDSSQIFLRTRSAQIES